MVRLLAICNKAYKFRLFPNEEQKAYFSKTFGCCRKIWNLMLNDKINHLITKKKAEAKIRYG